LYHIYKTVAVIINRNKIHPATSGTSRPLLRGRFSEAASPGGIPAIEDNRRNPTAFRTAFTQVVRVSESLPPEMVPSLTSSLIRPTARDRSAIHPLACEHAATSVSRKTEPCAQREATAPAHGVGVNYSWPSSPTPIGRSPGSLPAEEIIGRTTPAFHRLSFANQAEIDDPFDSIAVGIRVRYGALGRLSNAAVPCRGNADGIGAGPFDPA